MLSALIKIIGVVLAGGKSRLNKRSRGVNFCQVKRIVADGQLREAIVDGNHWYIGAIPAFVIKASMINIGLNLSQGVSQIAGPNKNSTDPVA